jgi:hypothetical protein
MVKVDASTRIDVLWCEMKSTEEAEDAQKIE